MKTRLLSTLSLAAFAGLVMVQSAHAQDSVPPVDFDARHEACLLAITKDADTAYEDALIWKGDGGGRRARHCVAMALFALGHKDEAASRLEAMGAEIRTGTPQMRADWLTESADFWLASGDARAAYRTSNEALNLVPTHLDARLSRARSYAKLERWDYAEIDLTSALVQHPGNVKALRYRADARKRLDKLQEASEDIELALRLDPTSVETALVRGEIREAIRLAAAP